MNIIKEYDDVEEIICFHCQQAVEKYLKALMISKGKEDIPKTHNIDLLLNLCLEYDKDFVIYTGTELTTYAVNLRYPDVVYIPDKDKVCETIKIANEIIEMCKKNISSECK